MEWLFKYLFPSYAKREKPDLNDSYRKVCMSGFTWPRKVTDIFNCGIII